MYSHKVYIVALSVNMRDVQVERVLDGDLFTLDTIVAGFKDRLKELKYQISIVGDNAYIDVIDQNNELINTYSIISKQVLLKKD